MKSLQKQRRRRDGDGNAVFSLRAQYFIRQKIIINHDSIFKKSLTLEYIYFIRN